MKIEPFIWNTEMKYVTFRTIFLNMINSCTPPWNIQTLTVQRLTRGREDKEMVATTTFREKHRTPHLSTERRGTNSGLNNKITNSLLYRLIHLKLK